MPTCIWGHWSGLWMLFNPIHQGGCAPFHPFGNPLTLHLVGGGGGGINSILCAHVPVYSIIHPSFPALTKQPLKHQPWTKIPPYQHQWTKISLAWAHQSWLSTVGGSSHSLNISRSLRNWFVSHSTIGTWTNSLPPLSPHQQFNLKSHYRSLSYKMALQPVSIILFPSPLWWLSSSYLLEAATTDLVTMLLSYWGSTILHVPCMLKYQAYSLIGDLFWKDCPLWNHQLSYHSILPG